MRPKGVCAKPLGPSWQRTKPIMPPMRACALRLRKLRSTKAATRILAWRLRAWFDERVGAAARARVAEVERLAWSALEGSLERDFPGELANDIGLPSSVSARHLLRELQCALAQSRKVEARINGSHSCS